MNRVTLFSDISGRPSRSLEGSTRLTAAAVALSTTELPEIRERLPSPIKWKDITQPAAEQFIELLANHSTAIGVASVELDTPAWHKALLDEQDLHSAIATESRAPAGWAKLPVLLKYDLLMRANLRTLAQLLIGQREKLHWDSRGLAAIECEIVTDEEISGEENISVFKEFWSEERVPNEALSALGFRVRHPTVTLTTEQDEPLLVLPDIVAGLAHSAHMPNPGRIPMPLPHKLASDLLNPLKARQLLAIDCFDFDTDYDLVFGETMAEARTRKKR